MQWATLRRHPPLCPSAREGAAASGATETKAVRKPSWIFEQKGGGEFCVAVLFDRATHRTLFGRCRRILPHGSCAAWMDGDLCGGPRRVTRRPFRAHRARRRGHPHFALCGGGGRLGDLTQPVRGGGARPRRSAGRSGVGGRGASKAATSGFCSACHVGLRLLA